MLTDGVNNVGEVDPGSGCEAGRPGRHPHLHNRVGAEEMVVPGFLFQRKVNPSAERDVETLTRIADLTGGRFQRARSTGELSQIYKALDELNPSNRTRKPIGPFVRFTGIRSPPPSYSVCCSRCSIHRSPTG